MPQKMPSEEKASLPNGDHQAVGIAPHGKFFYSAPIPPASEFERYESVLVGSADRILGMAERQSSHRQHIEKIVITFDTAKSVVGVICAPW